MSKISPHLVSPSLLVHNPPSVHISIGFLSLGVTAGLYSDPKALHCPSPLPPHPLLHCLFPIPFPVVCSVPAARAPPGPDAPGVSRPQGLCSCHAHCLQYPSPRSARLAPASGTCPHVSASPSRATLWITSASSPPGLIQFSFIQHPHTSSPPGLL